MSYLPLHQVLGDFGPDFNLKDFKKQVLKKSSRLGTVEDGAHLRNVDERTKRGEYTTLFRRDLAEDLRSIDEARQRAYFSHNASLANFFGNNISGIFRCVVSL